MEKKVLHKYVNLGRAGDQNRNLFVERQKSYKLLLLEKLNGSTILQTEKKISGFFELLESRLIVPPI